MGLLNFFDKLKLGNYGLVARNVAYITSVLEYSYIHRFDQYESLIISAGIINGKSYIKKNQLTINDFENAYFHYALNSKCGDKTIGAFEIFHGNIHTNVKNDLLLNYVLQLEVLYFSIDTNFTSNQIINAVISKKMEIANEITETQEAFKRGELSKPGWNNIILETIARIDRAEVD